MRAAWVVAAALALVVAAACGEDDTTVPYKQRLTQLERDPYTLTCGEQRSHAHYGKRAHFALADATHIPHINRLRAAQSIFYAITVICKGKPDSFMPANLAVAGVREGSYRAKLGAGD
jgi:uncharacterized protein YciW